MQLFNFRAQQLRTLEIDGEPMFVLKDVCDLLDLGQVAGVKRRLADDVISNHPIPDSLGRLQDTTLINEDGLYDVILESRKPEAKAFRKWITSEVIPSIRKHGAYMTTEVLEQTITSPDFIIQLATKLKEEQAERQRLFEMNRMLEQQSAYQEQQLQFQAPRVAFANLVIAAGNSQPMGTVAKAVGMGRTTLFRFLREKKFIMQNSTIPYQYFIDRGYFVVREVPIKHSDDRIVNEATARVTAKGLEFIAKLVMENRGA